MKLFKIYLLLLLLTFFTILLLNCDPKQNVIIVNKTLRGALAGEEMMEGFEHVSWMEIGLSRNGKEPIEYIWFAGSDPSNLDIKYSRIGEKGTIYLNSWAKQNKIKFPRPNAENPPVLESINFIGKRKNDF